MINDRPLTAVIWDYDGTLADTRAKNWGVTRHIVRRFTGTNPDEIEGLSSLEAYTRALHRTHSWRRLYVDEFGLSEQDTNEAGRLWTEYQLMDPTVTPVYDGISNDPWKAKVCSIASISSSATKRCPRRVKNLLPTAC